MEELIKRARKIKAILTDVDGILTDGKLNFFVREDGSADEFKSFNALDGIAARECQTVGMTLGIITGRRHPATVRRAANLGYKYLYEGFLTKLGPLEDILKRENLTAEEVAYIGDDVTDLPLLLKAGFAATVPNAVECVKSAAHYVTRRAGGDGAYREIVDFILSAQGKLQPLLEKASTDGWGAVKTGGLQIVTSQEGIS